MTPNERLERAADIIEIQQLAYRYAISVDSKNVQSMVELFTENLDEVNEDQAPNGFVGGIPRTQMIESFTNAFYHSPMSILTVGNHLVEHNPNNRDRAKGTVYCRAEIEFGDTWLVQQIVYFDRYVRENGKWLFLTRTHLLFYGVDHLQRPLGIAPSDARERTDGKGSMPQFWPSYRDYYAKFPDRKHY
jgi:hypothetical protein